MIHLLIFYSIYVGVSLLCIFVIWFAHDLFKKNRPGYLKRLRLLINYGLILLFCWIFLMRFAVVVHPPFEVSISKEQSLTYLKDWLISEELKMILYGLLLIGLLAFFNWIYKRKLEYNSYSTSVILTILINFTLLIITATLIYFETYSNMTIEIGNHFN